MTNYNDLIKQLNEFDESMKDIFEKRMSTLDKIIAIENQNSSSLCKKNSTMINTIKQDVNNKYINEYNYFLTNMNFLYEKYQYSKTVNYDKSYANKNSTQKISINTVCYQGLPFSYSESAAKSLFENISLINRSSFEDVFKSVHDGVADVGVLPIENSTAGYVNDVYDLLLKYDLYINYNYVKKVDHCIAGIINSNIEDIKEVYSHPQAIMQCKEYIKKNNLRAVNEINTAVAAQKTYKMNNKSTACICSPEAAIHYGLKIFENQINPKQNYTRFGAISKYLLAEENHNRISIVFTIPHKTGSLNNVLSIFSYYNINLSSIYSRPDLKSTWKYLFYLDFEGNILNNDIQAILHQLKEELPFIKILGSFEA